MATFKQKVATDKESCETWREKHMYQKQRGVYLERVPKKG